MEKKPHNALTKEARMVDIYTKVGKNIKDADL